MTADSGRLPAAPGSLTDTPETDRLEYEQECNFDVCWEDHARKLERQRDEARAAIKMCESAMIGHVSPKHPVWKAIAVLKAENDQTQQPPGAGTKINE